MTPATRFSYFFLVAVIVLAAATHLATPLITVLFSYFDLRKLHFGKRKWLSLVLFFIVVAATLYGLGFLVRQAFVAFAQSHGIELPFSDLDSLKAAIVDVVKNEFLFVGNFARAATTQLAFVLIGVVVAVSLFVNP